MRTRLMLIAFVVLATAATGCRSKKRGPYFAPEPARVSTDASQLQVPQRYELPA